MGWQFFSRLDATLDARLMWVECVGPTLCYERFFLGYFRFRLLQVELALNTSSKLLMHLMFPFAARQPKRGVLARRHFPQEQPQ